jgi:hypothetical protein
MCDYRRGMDWGLDLLANYTHHSELRVITAQLLISTLYKSLEHTISPFPAGNVFTRRFLITASNNGYSSTSVLSSSLNGGFLRTACVIVKVKDTLRLTVSQSVCLGIEPHLGPITRYLFLSDSYVLVSVGRPL